MVKKAYMVSKDAQKRQRAGCSPIVVMAWGLLLAAGCTPQKPSAGHDQTMYGSLPRLTPRPERTLRPLGQRAKPQEQTLGRSIGGRAIVCQILGDGREVVLILAGIHGNESAGTPLVGKLAEYLADHPEFIEGRRVILLPVANPDGATLSRRHNLHEVDLNRNFPAANYDRRDPHGSAPLSEPESRALYDLLNRYPPSRIVSIHQPLACIDYDGPGQSLALAMAACCDLPVKRLGGLPGSLGSYAGVTRGIPMVTVELPRSAHTLDRAALWQRYGRMLLTAIESPEAGHENGGSGRRER